MAFSFARIVSELGKNGISIPVFVKPVTGSTNNDAKELAQTCRGDFIVAADCQTGGKGTHGRRFFSPDRTGFYLSAAMDGLDPRAPVVLAAAVAAVRMIDEVCGKKTVIKWVNDILYDGRKAAGILCERSGSGTVIVGIGINLKEPEGGFPEEIRNTASALDVPPELADRMAAVFYSELSGLLRGGEDVCGEYRKHCLTIGSRVRFEMDGTVFIGCAEDMRDDGALIVRLPDSTVKELTSGWTSVTPLDLE